MLTTRRSRRHLWRVNSRIPRRAGSWAIMFGSSQHRPACQRAGKTLRRSPAYYTYGLGVLHRRPLGAVYAHRANRCAEKCALRPQARAQRLVVSLNADRLARLQLRGSSAQYSAQAIFPAVRWRHAGTSHCRQRNSDGSQAVGGN